LKVKKKKRTRPNKKTGLPQPEKTHGQEAEEKPFDFGGLPQRDLKKNLGCG
jgi:hypothetical protein